MQAKLGKKRVDTILDPQKPGSKQKTPGGHHDKSAEKSERQEKERARRESTVSPRRQRRKANGNPGGRARKYSG